MPNHIELIVMPADAGGLRASFAEAHPRYTGAIKVGSGGRAISSRVALGRGDGRASLFGSGPLDRSQSGGHGAVSPAEDWPWSSPRAQLPGEDDEFATMAPLRAPIPDFAAFLAMPTDAAMTTRIKRPPPLAAGLRGRNGSQRSSCRLGRSLARKPGPKARVQRDTARRARLL